MNKELSDQMIKELLEEKHDQYNRANFIDVDPIAIPHMFSWKNDIEVAGFLAATIAWGQRPMILKKGFELMDRMDRSPYDFVKNCSDSDLHKLENFVYRTFNSQDLIYFIKSLNQLINKYNSIGELLNFFKADTNTIYDLIIRFHNVFFEQNDPGRTRKHLANPARGSSAKRMNMYLRWMVRKDSRGVDFGLWDFIQPSELYLPLDVHTGRVGRKLGLLNRKSNDWKAVEEITKILRTFDPNDPVKYDFAIFGLGVFEKF
jgi:uncharacterized protein (TIGR02757 family)